MSYTMLGEKMDALYTDMFREGRVEEMETREMFSHLSNPYRMIQRQGDSICCT